MHSPGLPKQTPQFVKQVNSVTASVTNGVQIQNGIQHQSSKLSIANSGVPQSSSTAAGATASSMSSAKPGHGMHQTGFDFVQTPGSRGNRRGEGGGLIVVKQQSASNGKPSGQCHATHIVFDNDAMDAMPQGYRL